MRLTLLAIAVIGCACVTTPSGASAEDDAERQRLSNVCASNALEVSAVLNDRFSLACTTNADCVLLSPTLSGKCNVFLNAAAFEPNERVFHRAEASCNALGQVLPRCMSQVAFCNSGRCEGTTAAVIDEDCDRAKEALHDSIELACATNDDCTVMPIDQQLWAAAKNEKTTRLLAAHQVACGITPPARSTLDLGSNLHRAICVNQTCSVLEVGSSPRLTAPWFGGDCRERAAAYFYALGLTGQLRLTFIVHEDGYSNQFVFLGPEGLLPEQKNAIAELLHGCKNHPATFNGVPIAMQSSISLTLQNNSSF